jgi:predicted  nucleic acid-binding Zn-ribbon protein
MTNEHHRIGWLGRLIGIGVIASQLERLMADIAALQAELADVKASAFAAKAAVDAVLVGVGELKVQNADLKAQLDALIAGAVTQDQIDLLTVTASEIDDTVDAITVAATPVVEPPAEPVV